MRPTFGVGKEIGTRVISDVRRKHIDALAIYDESDPYPARQLQRLVRSLGTPSASGDTTDFAELGHVEAEVNAPEPDYVT
jgi:hypothetical protein